MACLMFAVFIISSCIHLYASIKMNARLRAQSKGFILLSLLGWYCFAAPEIRMIVVAALFFSWLGDLLLIPQNIKWFAAGGISFMISHICFVFSYVPQVDFASLSPVTAIAAAVIYITAAVMVFRGLRPWLPEALFCPMFLYLLINGAMNCFAFYQLLSSPCTASAITFAGAMLFFISDSVLFFVRFKKNTVWKTHFLPMLTYIIAELLIVTGLMGLG